VPALLANLMGFEGEVDMSAKAPDQTKPAVPVAMLVKGDKIRIDAIPGTETANALGGKSFLLVRVPDKKLDVVSDARKQLIELDLTSPELGKTIEKVNASNNNGHPTKHEPPPKVTKSGKETIAGYSCEDWEVTGSKDNKKKASLCVADLSSSFFHIPLTGLPGEYGFALDLVDGQHFPLRVVLYDSHTGAEAGRLEVTKLDPHPVDASKFDIPADYKKIDMLDLFQGAAGAPIPGIPSGIPSNLPIPPTHHHPHH
jgi:hypothetical protein